MLYAKAFKENDKYTGETLEQHTNDLLDGYVVLRNEYETEITRIRLVDNFWELLRLACVFHDLGKASSAFQLKIQKFLGEKIDIPPEFKKEIPHNFLSVAFLPTQKSLGLDNNSYLMLLYAIAYHHYRAIDFDEEYLKEIIQKDLSMKLNELQWVEKKLDVELKLTLSDNYFSLLDTYSNVYEQIKRDKEFIFLKGMLHRLDHSASAHLPVEIDRIENPSEKLIFYINTEKKGTLKDFQESAKEYLDKSVLLVASTGMGKTEFAINWIGKQKALYTLPIRVSVNAMYDRFAKIFGDKNIGLLHSDSLFYSLNSLSNNFDTVKDNLMIEDTVSRTNLSRQLSMPITITTADQLFTSVFKWHGYEKIYGTLMYSKVVVDEPQSYSPEILAMIIKALQETSTLGGRFCVMSATIHPFIAKQLSGCSELLAPVFNTEKKHKIVVKDSDINGLLSQIENSYSDGKKILVIVNTVKKSQDMFKKLQQFGNVKLLHSEFIQRDRRKKESEIQSDCINGQPIIWITTQIVEASLDIDYDMLFTEIAALDSLIQRMGRVYRGSGRTINNSSSPNVIIAGLDPSDNFAIYDKEIVGFTEEALRNYDGEILTEELKQKIMNSVYDTNKIKSTNYYKKFKYAYDLLDNGFEVDKKGEAQRLFRNIANVAVIPEGVYLESRETIDKAILAINNKKLPLLERMKEMNVLNNFTVSVPTYKLKASMLEQIKGQTGIYILKANYDCKLGLTFDEPELDDFSNVI